MSQPVLLEKATAATDIETKSEVFEGRDA